MESSDSTVNYKEIESKKWSFSRLDEYHNFAISTFQNTISAGENSKNESLATNQTRKNRTFSIIGAILTFLFGYSSIYQLELNIFLGFLAIITFVSIIMYAYYNYISSTITKELNIILNILNKLTHHIITSREISITTFYNLENIKQKEIDDYFAFLRLLLHCLILEYQEKTHRELNPILQSSSKAIKNEKEHISLLIQAYDSIDKTNLPEIQVQFISEVINRPQRE